MGGTVRINGVDVALAEAEVTGAKMKARAGVPADGVLVRQDPDRNTLVDDAAPVRVADGDVFTHHAHHSKGGGGGASVWYAWTAPTSGAVAFDTHGSDFDTVLAVYTGSAVASLTMVVHNDDAAGRLTSRVEMPVTAGTTYRIAVDGYGGETGEVVLGWALRPG